jgi:hypothetical protein
MQAKPVPYILGICLVAVMAGAASTRSSWFEARTSGSKALELSGAAEFGEVEGDVGSHAFVLTLGAESPTGAVVLTWPSGARPEPGVYRVSEDGTGVRALVLTGPATAPTGAFRAHGGMLTVSRSRAGILEGTFDLKTAGFEVATPMDEERSLAVHGEFTARPASAHQTRTLSAGER